MAQASAIAPSMSKEEWIARRAATARERKPASREAKRVHGKRVVPSGATALPSSEMVPAVLASIPSSVPELPDSYLVRDKDLSELKAALLAKNGPNSAALTSETRKVKSSRTAAHGMGGVGKTTIAAALVHDDQIRAAFSKIVWVSVGQEPDIRELQEAIHEQLLEKGITDSANTPSLVSTALRNAAKGVKVLLVCDDVWDPKHEKPLNCIDGDNGSRLLVTTRIQKLLNNSCEVSVGVLSENDALQLLLSSANMEEGSMPEGGDEHRIALEIVELCGRLPLTLAIAGGMISDHPKGFDDELVELMREDRLRDQDDDEDGSGTTLEERIVRRYTRPSPIFTLSISNDPRFTGNRSLHHSK